MDQLTDLLLPVSSLVYGDVLVRHPEMLQRFKRDRRSTVMLLSLVPSGIIRFEFGALRARILTERYRRRKLSWCCCCDSEMSGDSRSSASKRFLDTYYE
jgi:hypothetical protein